MCLTHWYRKPEQQNMEWSGTMKRIHDVYPETTRDGFVCFFVRRRASTSHRSGPALFCLFWRFLSRRWWKKMGSLKQTVRKTEVFKTNQDFGRFWMAPLDQESSRGQRVDSIVSSHMSQKVRTKPGSVGFLDQYSSCRGNQELNCFHFWMWFRFTGWWFGTWLLFSPS